MVHCYLITKIISTDRKEMAYSAPKTTETDFNEAIIKPRVIKLGFVLTVNLSDVN